MYGSGNASAMSEVEQLKPESLIFKGAHMYGSGNASAMSEVEQLKPVGIHPQLSDLGRRISASIDQVDKMLDRVRGSQPTPVCAAGKEEREPSTQEWAHRCHKAMSALEIRIEELQNAIS